MRGGQGGSSTIKTGESVTSGVVRLLSGGGGGGFGGTSPGAGGLSGPYGIGGFGLGQDGYHNPPLWEVLTSAGGGAGNDNGAGGNGGFPAGGAGGGTTTGGIGGAGCVTVIETLFEENQ